MGHCWNNMDTTRGIEWFVRVALFGVSSREMCIRIHGFVASLRTTLSDVPTVWNLSIRPHWDRPRPLRQEAFQAETEIETETTATQDTGNFVRSMRVWCLVNLGSETILSCLASYGTRQGPFGVNAGSGKLQPAPPFLRSSLQDGPWNMEQRGLGFWVFLSFSGL